MNIVKFPGLNLEFEFSKIAFSIFGVSIYKYAICIVLGVIVALILCRLAKEKFEIDYNFVLENTILAIIFGTIGARLYFVLFNLEYYLNHISEIFNFRSGGLAIYGGLIFGAIAIIVNCKIRKKDVLNFFDCIIPYVAIAQCFGRFGNFFNVEAFGYQTTSFIRMGINSANGYMEVHPTFLYEAIATFIIFIILKFVQKKRSYKGQVLLWYCLLYSLVRTFIEGLRVDSLMFYNLRVSQVLSILILILSISMMICRKLCMKMKCSKKEGVKEVQE